MRKDGIDKNERLLIAGRISNLECFTKVGIRYLSASVAGLILRGLCGGWKAAIWFLFREQMQSWQKDLYFFWHMTICRRTPLEMERRLNPDGAEEDEFEDWIQRLGSGLDE